MNTPDSHEVHGLSHQQAATMALGFKEESFQVAMLES